MFFCLKELHKYIISPCFGWIGGWVMSHFLRHFVACMIYLKINYLLWRKCFIGGGMWVGKLGSGGASYAASWFCWCWRFQCFLGVCFAIDCLQNRICSAEARYCVSGCGFHESECHLIVSCAFFGHLWQLVRNWLCVHSADPSHILDHFILRLLYRLR